ncbi:MAG: 2Fe-2S iron-sulfur cluster binding domain-containing protein [Deltaproteobacteria bacterium]|nr:2Fe-2S iron-sulfur cluster binding domain-containing protein [Deltaproteobacteria bacterium]
MAEDKSKRSRGSGPVVSRRGFLKGGAVTTAALSTGVLGGLPAEAQTLIEPRPKGLKSSTVTLKVNGLTYQVTVEHRRTLADVLRKDLGLTGTKVSCDRGECGACTVIMNGRTVYSCSTLAVRASGQAITTIEGLAQGDALHPVQKAFLENDAFQCGFCTPGMVLAVKALVDKNKQPSREDVKRAISGNICRCAAYMNIVNAAMAAAKMA